MDAVTLPELLAGLTGLAMFSLAALRGWQGWLTLKHRELELNARVQEGNLPSAMQRIELADLKDRLRKLEAIAAGVDL
ncbi:hypothetical protein EOE18_14895 [Novosphingobium umbonatum]|uniref:DUF2730 family protein n=1 Tax=Novosphingobium umbonatum TaxID=1908524 RepID=A0A3S2USF9_9SPHN|nr:hypothetical protein [Novosphingobium umbonatum]RVU03607.1 hypothetical protein EOE18_14895 [Novosphingobium umbonatum]